MTLNKLNRWAELVSQGQHLAETLRSQGQGVARQVRRRIYPRPPISPLALVLTGVASALAGAGLMYLLDPISGRRRRHLLLDKSTSMYRRSGEKAAHFKTDISNRARGFWHDVSSLGGADEADDKTIRERVRAALGHVASQIGSVEVECSGGIVTLSGRALEQEATAILRAAQGTRGVHAVVDHLQVQRGPEETRPSWRAQSAGMDPAI